MRHLLIETFDQKIEMLEASKASMVDDTATLDNMEDFLSAFADVEVDKCRLMNMKEELANVELGY